MGERPHGRLIDSERETQKQIDFVWKENKLLRANLQLATDLLCKFVDNKNLSSEGMSSDEYAEYVAVIGRLQDSIKNR